MLSHLYFCMSNFKKVKTGLLSMHFKVWRMSRDLVVVVMLDGGAWLWWLVMAPMPLLLPLTTCAVIT